jgi:hypothetical protein
MSLSSSEDAQYVYPYLYKDPFDELEGWERLWTRPFEDCALKSSVSTARFKRNVWWFNWAGVGLFICTIRPVFFRLPNGLFKAGLNTVLYKTARYKTVQKHCGMLHNNTTEQHVALFSYQVWV